MRRLYTYEVYVDSVAEGNRIAWRKKASRAGEFAASLVDMHAPRPIIISRRERRPEDFQRRLHPCLHKRRGRPRRLAGWPG